MPYSKRLEEAFAFAHDLHRDQTRKGSDIPYVTHLMGVAALVGEFGGDEDQVIGALLHDAAEDQGGVETVALIRERFGETVAAYVEGCSDTLTTPKPPWLERKKAFIESTREAPPTLRLLIAADKLYNARSMVADFSVVGHALWDRFSVDCESTLWYHREMLDVLRQGWDNPILGELENAIHRLDEAAAGEPPKA